MLARKTLTDLCMKSLSQPTAGALCMTQIPAMNFAKKAGNGPVIFEPTVLDNSNAEVKSSGKEFIKNDEGKYIVTLFKGHGIGPEIADSVIQIFKHANIPISWEHHEIHTKSQTKDGDLIS